MSNQQNKYPGTNAIVTAYREFNFRSRLEAKYAYFFDLLGWQWSYEPIDLNGWIPDFALGEWPTLVEVKPYFHFEEWAEELKKIESSGCRKPVILFGPDPTFGSGKRDVAGGVPIGWIHYPMSDDIGGALWQTFDLHFGITEGNDKPGLCPMDGGCEVCGANKPVTSAAVYGPLNPDWQNERKK